MSPAEAFFPGFGVQTEGSHQRSEPFLFFHKGDGPTGAPNCNGYPEDPHQPGNKVAPRLAERFFGSTYLDLRGYGDSSPPRPNGRSPRQLLGPRAMALDQVETMASFWPRAVPCGCPTIAVASRLAHRLLVSTFPKSGQKGFWSHGHRSDVDDVRTNQTKSLRRSTCGGFLP